MGQGIISGEVLVFLLLDGGFAMHEIDKELARTSREKTKLF